MSVMKRFVFYSQGIEHKSTLDAETNEPRYFVKGHIDSGDLDLVNDIVTKNCMVDIQEQLKARSIKLDFDHETLRKGDGEDDVDAKLNITKIPLGKAVSYELDDKGNVVEFELNPNWKKFDSRGNVVMSFEELWANIKGGFYDSFSIAYVPVRTTMGMINDVKARMLDKINLINVALTGNPINPGATMTSVFAKSIEYADEFDILKNRLDKVETMLGDFMTDKEQKSDEQEVEVTPAVEGESEPVLEAPVVDAPEEKSVETVDAKSFAELKAKIDAIEDTLSKIDGLLGKAIPSGVGAENKSVKAELVTAKSNATLDLI